MPSSPGAEDAAASLGRLAGWLGVLGRFSPVAAAITGYDVAKGAYPIPAAVGQAARGDFYTPADDESFNDLDQQLRELQDKIEGIKRRTFKPDDHDPELIDLRQQLQAAQGHGGASDVLEATRLKDQIERRGMENAQRNEPLTGFDPVRDQLERQVQDLTNRMNTYVLKQSGVIGPGHSFIDQGGARVDSSGRVIVGMGFEHLPVQPLRVGPGIEPRLNMGLNPATPIGGTDKVDVAVSGEAEVHQTMQIEVMPSQYFLGLIKTAEAAVKMTIGGSIGSTMVGSNAPKHPAPTGGIGHM